MASRHNPRPAIRQAIEDLTGLALDRYPALRFMPGAFELRVGVTAHHATHIALAESLGCDLWTADERLAKEPGPTCRIGVIQ